MTAFVLSAGGHARVVVAALTATGTAVSGVTDRDPARKGTLVEGVPVIGSDDIILSSFTDGVMLYNGLGNVARRDDSGLSNRRQLFERFRNSGFQFPVLCARGAIAAFSAELAAGAQVMIGALVQAGAYIGENTIVNTGAIIEHDCRVGSHCHVAPGAILCGGVACGDETHIGAGAVILQGVSIPSGAVVPAGVVVRRWNELRATP